MDKIVLWKKGLVIVITVLFIGVSFQSVVGVETETPLEDCGCEDIDNIQFERIGILIDRLEDYTNSMLLLSKRNPVVYDKCLEVSNGVNTISENYDELLYTLDWEYPIICAVYEMLYNFIVSALDTCNAIIDYLDQFLLFGILLYNFIFLVRVFLVIWGYRIELHLYGFGCWEP